MFLNIYRVREFYQKHFLGEEGINKILKIAYPVMISQGSESLMTFIGRLMVSPLGKEFPALSMSGGMTSFVFMIPFTGTVSYTTALVAQYIGAGKKEVSGQILSSAFFLCLCLAPLILYLGWSLGPHYLSFAKHPTEQIEIEMKLVMIILSFVFIYLLKFTFAGFFAGLGRTPVIMKANLMALIVYIPSCYILVFKGVLNWIPPLGIYGVPWASVISNFLILIVYLFHLFSKTIRNEYLSANWWRPRFLYVKKLITFGGPSGIEYLMTFFTFITFVNLFHQFGPDAKAAITIALSWDVLIFLPVMGINVATTGLVGKCMGAGDPDRAVKVTHTSLKLALLFMGIVSIFFQIFTDDLVNVFIPTQSDGIDFALVRLMGHTMVKTVAIYCLFDGMILVFSGALRGSGDTKWCMFASITLHWLMLAIVYYFIHIKPIEAIYVWYIFMVLIIVVAMTFMGRFYQGAWKKIRVVGP